MASNAALKSTTHVSFKINRKEIKSYKTENIIKKIYVCHGKWIKRYIFLDR